MTVCPSCGTTENPARARFCLECGAPLSPAPTEERRVVTILFVDLVGFTERSDRADPEDVRRVLVPFHSLVKGDLERYGGTLDKFIGDAVMGVFGAPVAHEDDPARAVRAGLAVLRSMEGLRRTDPQLSVRIAVNTGEAVVAFGSGPQVGEAVAGDVVNTASRMQALAPRDGLVVGAATLRALGEGFDAQALPPATVKGKAEPITVWRILGERSAEARRPDGTSFVGRTHELARLVEAFDEAVRGPQVRFATVVAEPGMGKTRLALAFRERIAGRARWVRGRCLPYGDAVTFAPVAETVRQVAGIDPADEPEAATDRVSRLAGDVPGRDGDAAWLTGRLLQVLGLAGTDPGGQEPLTPEELARAWALALLAGGPRDPLIVAVEDLHWAEPVLVEVVAGLGQALDGRAALVVCTGRPEMLDGPVPWMDGPAPGVLVRLGPLSVSESERLVEDLLGSSSVGLQGSSLVARAEGNPLFAVELARMLQDRPEGVERLDASVPQTVRAVIGARLDAVPADQRALVLDAAVVGSSFWPGALATMGPRTPADVDAALTELVRRGLVVRSERSDFDREPEFAFSHSLIREVAYARLPREARARRHLAAGTWIQGAAGDRAVERAEVLASHFAVATETAQAAGLSEVAAASRPSAVDWLLRAGERVRRVGASESFALFDRATKLAPPGSGERAQALLWSARMGRFSGRIDAEEIERRYQEALALFQAAGDDRAVGATLTRLGSHAGAMGDSARSRDLLASAVEVLEAGPAGPDLARAYAYQAEERMFAGHIDRSLDFAGRALRIMEGRPPDDIAVMALHIRGDARCAMGDAGGLEDLEAALRLAESEGNMADIVTSRDYLAEWVWMLESPAAALPHIEASLAIAEARGQVSQGQWTKAGGLAILFDLGRWDDALAWGDDLLAGGRDRVDDSVYAVVRTMRSRILSLRDVPEAEGGADELLALAGSVAELQAKAPALVTAAELALASRRPDLAAECLRRFAEATAGVAAQYREGELARIARACVRTGEVALAERLVAESGGLTRRDALNLASARATLAEAGADRSAADLHVLAAEGWGAFGCPFEEAMALLAAARCGSVGGDGRDERAWELLATLGVTAPTR